VVHNGTPRSLDVVLGSGGVSLGQIVEVIEPGQRSQAIPLRSSGPYVHVRDQATKEVIEQRQDPRVRYEYACENGS